MEIKVAKMALRVGPGNPDSLQFSSFGLPEVSATISGKANASVSEPGKQHAIQIFFTGTNSQMKINGFFFLHVELLGMGMQYSRVRLFYVCFGLASLDLAVIS